MPQYDKYRYGLGQRAYEQAASAAAAPAPTGRSPGAVEREMSGAAQGAARGTREALAGLARNLGGTTNPLYAMMAARLQQGGEAIAGGAMGDIAAREADRNAQTELARRQQMLGAAGVGAQIGSTQAQTMLGAERNQLAANELGQSERFGNLRLGLAGRGQALSEELGRGGLALQQELGRGNLAARAREAVQQGTLQGQSNRITARRNEDMYNLGMAQLASRNYWGAQPEFQAPVQREPSYRSYWGSGF